MDDTRPFAEPEVAEDGVDFDPDDFWDSIPDTDDGAAVSGPKEDDFGFGSLDQAGIDALFGGSSLPPRPLDPGSALVEDDYVPGSLDQAAIDKLFAQPGDASATSATTSHPNPVTDPGADPYSLDQAAIDALFAERPPYHRVATGEASVAAPSLALPVADHEARSPETEKLLHEARDFAFTLNNLSMGKTFHLSHQQRGDQVYGDADPDFINFLNAVNSKRDKYRINFNIPNQFHVPVGGEMVITEVHAAVGFDLDESGRPVIDIEAETEISESELLLEEGFDRVLTIGKMGPAEMHEKLVEACRDNDNRAVLRLSDGSLWGVEVDPGDEKYLVGGSYDNPSQRHPKFFDCAELANGIGEDKTLRGTDFYVNDGSKFEPTERGYFLLYPNRLGIGLEFGPAHTYSFKHDNEAMTGYFVYVNPVVSGATLVPSTQVSVFFKPVNGNRIIEKMTVRELMNGLNQPENFARPAYAAEPNRDPEPPDSQRKGGAAEAEKRDTKPHPGGESEVAEAEAEKIDEALEKLFQPVTDLAALLERGTDTTELEQQPLRKIDEVLFGYDLESIIRSRSIDLSDVAPNKFRAAFNERQGQFRRKLARLEFERVLAHDGQAFDRSRVDILPSSEPFVITDDPLLQHRIAGVTPGNGGYIYKKGLVRPALAREYYYKKPED